MFDLQLVKSIPKNFKVLIIENSLDKKLNIVEENLRM